MTDNVDESLIIGLLHDKINEVSKISDEIQDLNAQMKRIDMQIQPTQDKLKMAVGAREILRSLVIPQDMTLAEAWKNDYKKLRTKRETNDQSIRRSS